MKRPLGVYTLVMLSFVAISSKSYFAIVWEIVHSYRHTYIL